MPTETAELFVHSARVFGAGRCGACRALFSYSAVSSRHGFAVTPLCWRSLVLSMAVAPCLVRSLTHSSPPSPCRHLSDTVIAASA